MQLEMVCAVRKVGSNSMVSMFIQLIIHFNADCCIIFLTESFYQHQNAKYSAQHTANYFKFSVCMNMSHFGLFAFFIWLDFYFCYCCCCFGCYYCFHCCCHSCNCLVQNALKIHWSISADEANNIGNVAPSIFDIITIYDYVGKCCVFV